MKVGFLTASASRQAGGLFWAMAPLARQLSEANCGAEVFAGRDRYSEEDRPHWGRVPLHVSKKVGPSAFGYALGLSERLKATQWDVLHTHGLWMHPSVAASAWGRRTGKPWLVSPHGMLDPWAIRNARWKKRLAGLAYENRHLHGAACLHALCEAEADAFRAYGLTNPIALIPNGVDLPELTTGRVRPDWERDLPQSARVLLFLGRLHPKKGLLALLEAWARVADSSNAPWRLVVAGWDQNSHRSELERLAVALRVKNSVYFAGPQFGEHKMATLQRADAFVLPSLSEGLPMAVLEAWANGLPVLMTPQCNLTKGFAAGAAVRADPEVESLSEGIEAIFNSPDGQLADMGGRGRALVEAEYNWPRIADQMCEVYRWVLGQGATPNCVRLD